MEPEVKQAVQTLKALYHAAGMNDTDIIIAMIIILTQRLYNGEFPYGIVNNGTGDMTIKQSIKLT